MLNEWRHCLQPEQQPKVCCFFLKFSLRWVSSFQFSFIIIFKVLFFVVALLVVVALNVITGTKRVSFRMMVVILWSV